MVNVYILAQNALLHDDSCIVNFDAKLKIALTGLILLTVYFLLKLAHFFVNSASDNLENKLPKL